MATTLAEAPTMATSHAAIAAPHPAAHSLPTLTTLPTLTARRSLRRWLAHRWELLGVLTLLGSSGAVALYLLMHLAG